MGLKGVYSHLLLKSGSTSTKLFKSRAFVTIEADGIGAIANRVKAVSVAGSYFPRRIARIVDLFERVKS